MEAINVVRLHERLSQRMPETQLLWMPSTSGTQYRCNVSFNMDDDHVIDQIEKYCTGQDSIQLTIKDGYVYYN